MPKQATSRFPAIAVDDEVIKLKVDITRELQQEIERYTAYFTEQTGKKPRSQEAVIAGLLGDCLDRDSAFQKWKKQRGDKAQPKAPS
ncbi:MAG: DUF2274 domain-containing protein [Betaproteobacteria bacterium]|nr:DUF2274 domain-containing protein [Betaproteobacteria bacterium]